MNRFATSILCAAVAVLALAQAATRVSAFQQSPEQRKPPAVAAISQRMGRFVSDHEIAGAVTLVATPDRIVHLDATGMADIALNKPMQPDAIFWIASMTKPITATAVLLLQDEGKLSVDDPVENYLPEFKGTKTADGKTAQLTIRYLLTHTSGMGEVTADQARGITKLAGLIPLYAAKPLAREPGTKWVYCQSGINTAGRIVEVVSGESFDQFLAHRLFGPLGMKDTTFYLSEQQLPRLATSYRRTGKGELEATQNVILYGKSATSRDRFPAANGGLFSTAFDYARFCQMILNGGELGGRRFVKPESVKLMTTIQTGELTTGFTPGNGWGLGWCVIRKPEGITAMLSSGTFGHGGAYGTQAWIDPAKRRIYLLLVQRANFPNSDASDVRRGFQESATSALESARSEKEIRAFEREEFRASAGPIRGPGALGIHAAAPRLIVRGDDMGFSHSGNEAILKCFKEGIETSIEVIVPSPWFPEAAKMLAENSTVDVGIHLALTSEWDNVKWRPLADVPSLRDEDGYFYPMIFPNKNYPKRSLRENSWTLIDVEKEFRAQIELAKKRIPRVSHVSGHMGCDAFSPEVRTLARKLAKEYGLDIEPREQGVAHVGYVGRHATSGEKVESFLKMLGTLKAGQRYLFVDHPGLDTPELRAIHHIGYEQVAADRQGVTDVWTDPRVRELVKTKGIQLISYKDLKKE
jgi:CubicO group peptidase (beta-lactamase class C family)/predicted glycoside hydrolase/deacetylase ChbG (UPF0249 family)